MLAYLTAKYWDEWPTPRNHPDGFLQNTCKTHGLRTYGNSIVSFAPTQTRIHGGGATRGAHNLLPQSTGLRTSFLKALYGQTRRTKCSEAVVDLLLE